LRDRQLWKNRKRTKIASEEEGIEILWRECQNENKERRETEEAAKGSCD
jgi:putative protein kinase ArgK-like GTPase of G3E family